LTAADLMLALVVVIWGAHFAVVKQALEVVDPVVFGLGRFGLAAGALLLVVRLREGSLGLQPQARLPMLALGAVGAANQLLWMYGLQGTTSGKSALIYALSPSFVAIMQAMEGKRVNWRVISGFTVALVGVAAIVNPGHIGPSQLTGDLLTLAAAVAWAAYTNAGPRLLRSHSPLRVTAWTFLITAATMAPVGLVHAARVPWDRLPTSLGWQLGYSGLLGAGLAWVLWYRAVRDLGPLRVMAYQYMVPVVALGVSVLGLREPFRWNHALGAALVLAGTLTTRTALQAGPSPAAERARAA